MQPGLRPRRAYKRIMGTLDELPDRARLRLLPVTPALDEQAAQALAEALDRLFAQFVREGRTERWAVEALGGGAVLAIAYDGGDELSGCSHDKIAQVLSVHEQRGGRALLAAPPLVLEVDGAPRCTDRAGLRALVAAGAVGPDTIHWDLRVITLGEWRAHGRAPARGTWLAPLIARAAGAGPG